MRNIETTTSFQEIFDVFNNLVTDDLYLEWTQEETAADLANLLEAAIPQFEFPRFNVFDYNKNCCDEDEDEKTGYFNNKITKEEINILARLTIIEWLNRQILTIDITKQKYSAKDFSLTSQANHLNKLLSAKNLYKNEVKGLQRLYKRRKISNTGISTNYSGLGGKS